MAKNESTNRELCVRFRRWDARTKQGTMAERDRYVEFARELAERLEIAEAALGRIGVGAGYVANADRLPPRGADPLDFYDAVTRPLPPQPTRFTMEGRNRV